MQLDGVKASLVWDGSDQVVVPESMGHPRPDQMTGSLVEQVVELAVRICYDSLGKKRARNTEDNLAHILDVRHWSTLEHPHRTIELRMVRNGLRDMALALLNRPGVWVRYDSGEEETLRITTNPRTILEWDLWTKVLEIDSPSYMVHEATVLGAVLKCLWSRECPLLIHLEEELRETYDYDWPGLQDLADARDVRFVEPETDRERWISLYLSGSRGLSHEQVRHGDWTAISQRSTRYVGEDQSPWIWHPLLQKYLDDPSVEHVERRALRQRLEETEEACRKIYGRLVSQMQPWLKKDLDRRDPQGPYNGATARKQARGAARGFLGNALSTDMIFSASVAQWRHMLYMRAADAADAEIRMLYTREGQGVLAALRQSRYADSFADLTTVPASDGLGEALSGGGHR